jgi:hypothetical protein
MKNHITLSCFTIALTTFLLVCGSGVVLGQGGTGREPTPSPSPSTKQPPKSSQPAKRSTTSSRGSRSGSSKPKTDTSSAPSTPTTSNTAASSTSAAKERDESSATLSETLNWLGTKLADPTFLTWIDIGEKSVIRNDISDAKYLLGSPSFAVDQCTLTVNHYKSSELYKSYGSGKVIINLSNADPNSVKAETNYQYTLYFVILRTNTASIKYVSNTGEEMTGSSVKIRVSSAEGQSSVEKAIKHAVRLCGGKASQF